MSHTYWTDSLTHSAGSGLFSFLPLTLSRFRFTARLDGFLLSSQWYSVSIKRPSVRSQEEAIGSVQCLATELRVCWLRKRRGYHIALNLRRHVEVAMSSNNEKDDLLTTEEQLVFASIDASVHDVDTYEDDVIRKATHQLAPTLSGVAFPFLHSLAPSYSALRPEQYNPSDAPHFHTMLSRVREQLAAATNINNTANSTSTITPEQQQNILHLKEQMLDSRPSAQDL